MGGLSIWHWLVVLLVVVLIFGTKKLRNMGSDLGGAVKGFKDGMREGGESQSQQATESAKVADQSATEKETIDVQAKQKS